MIVSTTELVRLALDGARVAEYRLEGFQPEGTGIVLDARDDHGNAEASVAAVEELAAAGVAAIIHASPGPHAAASLRRAAELQVSVLLPYEPPNGIGADATTSWLTGTSGELAAAALRQYGDDNGYELLVLATTEPYLDAGRAALGARVVAKPQMDWSDVAVEEVLRDELAGDKTVPVVWADAPVAAKIVGAIQRLDGPRLVLLAPSARLPGFALELERLERPKRDELSRDTGSQASLDGNLITVGPAATDLDRDAGMASFLHALEVAAMDRRLSFALLPGGHEPRLGFADTIVHDAVLAIVAAASAADSTSAEDVLAALHELHEVEGLAGPELDFRRQSAVAAGGLTLLRADPAVGTARSNLPGGIPLVWLPLGTAEEGD